MAKYFIIVSTETDFDRESYFTLDKEAYGLDIASGEFAKWDYLNSRMAHLTQEGDSYRLTAPSPVTINGLPCQDKLLEPGDVIKTGSNILTFGIGAMACAIGVGCIPVDRISQFEAQLASENASPWDYFGEIIDSDSDTGDEFPDTQQRTSLDQNQNLA